MCSCLQRALRTLRFVVDELVPGTNTLETKPTGRGSLEAVMAERKSRKCSSFIWRLVLSSVSRHLNYGWYPEQMPDGKLSFKSSSTRWHIQAKKAMPERICNQGIQTRKVKVEQLRPAEWRIIRQSFTWPIPVVKERIIVLNAPFYYCVLSVLAFE